MPEVPIDPGILSRDPAVGEAYAADDLVYHGGFHRKTLEAIFAGVRTVAAGPGFGAPGRLANCYGRCRWARAGSMRSG